LKTAGPSILAGRAESVSGISAVLGTSINPNGQETTYRFFVVDQTQFEQSGFLGSVEVPPGGDLVGAGTSAVQRTRAIGALIPGTEYEVLVEAGNSAGVSRREFSFQTLPAPLVGLPDGRAYEQATPVDKNGANVKLETNNVRAAANGNGITFFSNAGIPGGEGAAGLPTYLATRDSDGSGWTTQGLLPAATTGPEGALIGWNEELSETFSMNREIGGETVLYARSSASHTLTPVAAGDPKAYRFAGSSADGNLVLFEQPSVKLAEGAAAGAPNAYLWNRATGKVTLAGALNTNRAPVNGTFAGPFAWFSENESWAEAVAQSPAFYYTGPEHAISEDGSRLFFTGAKTGRLYVRENPSQPQSPLSGTTCTNPELACAIEISAPEAGVVDPNGQQPAAFVGAAVNGNVAYFLSSQKLTADATTGTEDEGVDLYRYDLPSHELLDVTPDAEAAHGAEVQGVLGMSADGSTVYFAANGILTEVPNGAGERAQSGNCEIARFQGECNIYAWHAGEVLFIARVAPGAASESLSSDRSNWSPSSRPDGLGNEAMESTARVSRDGSVLMFRSVRRLGSYNNDGVAELYRYKLGGAPTCVSCDPSGVAPVGPAALQSSKHLLASPKLPFGVLTRNLSDTGNQVFFETPDALVEGDTNGVADVYEWEAPGASPSCGTAAQDGGCLFLLSTGRSTLPSEFADADETGENVFFSTYQSLVGQDRDELADVYDARVGGGIPSQSPSEVAPCANEEACNGPVSAAPGFTSPQTSVSGPGNPKALSCKKGFRREIKKGRQRCVKISGSSHSKKKHKKKAEHHQKGGNKAAKSKGKGKGR
jgi:hypothetical protein